MNIENNLKDREIEELTRELQYFPLALGQATAYIQDKGEESKARGDKRFEINDYLKEYQRHAGKLLKEGVYENEDCYTKTVLTTWNITMTYIFKEYGFEALSILEIMAYLAPDNIRIKEIFSKLITDDKAKLWNAVKLLNRYSMIELREGMVNIHRLVQKVTRLKLQENRQEEKTLRKALELVNSGNLVQDSMSHVASIWEYASGHGKLIDDFYFNSSYIHREPFFIKQSTPLHLLAEGDNYEAVETLLTHIEERHTSRLSKVVNAKDEDGYTPLHLAAYSGKLDAVKRLVSKGAGINTKDKYSNTPLHMAAEGGKLDIVEHGADVNTKDKYDETPLCIAIRSGKLEIVKHFFNKGADIDKYDGIILHLAVCNENPAIVEYLISKGVDVNAKYHKMSLHLAATRGLGGAIFFIQKGGNINTKSKKQ